MRVSVVIPVFNRGEKVLATIDSALSQDLPGQFEVLVVDDGSTDDTLERLRIAYENQARVQLFALSHGGVARARNFGLWRARGEFVAFLDHDDRWLPAKLRLQLARFDERPHVGVVSCGWREEFDGSGESCRSRGPQTPRGLVQKRLLRGNVVRSMSLPLVRTGLLREVGGFDETLVPCDDWDVWLRLAGVCEFDAVREVLAVYRRHEKQQSRDFWRMARAGRAVMRKHWRLYVGC